MLRNLSQLEGQMNSVHCDVCIVGGGTAGLLLARRLVDKQLTVAVVEMGIEEPVSPGDAGMEVQQLGVKYRGAERGRSIGLGGTSVLWGGQMIPLTQSDFGSREYAGFEKWPIQLEELMPHFGVVRELLGLPEQGLGGNDRSAREYREIAKLSPDLKLRLSEWLPFKMRNVAKALRATIERADRLTVWLNARVEGFGLQELKYRSAVRSLEAVSSNGKRLSISASDFVISAGALESTRMLLEIDQQFGGIITRNGAPLGKHFSDHLSVICGRFENPKWRAYNRSVAPCFAGAIMRTPRLELSDTAQKKQELASAFAHFTFVTHGDTGFDVVRNVLRRRQGESRTLGLTPKMLFRTVKDVYSMAFYRYVYKQLYIPRQADLLLQVDIEQAPNVDSRVFLGEKLDRYGKRSLVIDWRIVDEDVRCLQTVTKLAIDSWTASPMAEIAQLRSTLPEKFENFETLYDVYHPTGTIRMGDSERSSVLDSNLKSWAIDNLYVSSTAIFPSAGSANPGFTHLALTSRLADHLSGKLRAKLVV